jgi:hypothetical protein
MPTLILIEKTGVAKEISVKQYVESDLYKKAGFKSAEDFKLHTTWNVDINQKKYSIDLYGKSEGRANQENKYDFPPPVDNILFFGACILVNKNSNKEVVNLTESEWDLVYEKLFDGFEDIGDKDSDDDEDDEEFEFSRTKEGYAKDGFVVEDDESEDYDDESDAESDVSVKQNKKTLAKKSQDKAETIFISLSNKKNEADYLDCKSELSEEDYFE